MGANVGRLIFEIKGFVSFRPWKLQECGTRKRKRVSWRGAEFDIVVVLAKDEGEAPGFSPPSLRNVAHVIGPHPSGREPHSSDVIVVRPKRNIGYRRAAGY